MITAQQAITNWENFYDTKTGLSQNALLQMINILNQELYSELYSINPRDYIAETTISYIEDTKEYALPSDFESMTLVGCGVYIYDNNEYQEEVLAYSKGSNIYIDDVLVGGTVLKLKYVPVLAQITDLTSETVIPDRYQRVLLCGLDKMIALRDDDIQKYNNSGQMYAQAVEEMKKTIQTTPSVYSLSDPTNPF